MNKYTKQDILRLAQENDVRFVRLQFTDLFGSLKNMAVSMGRIENALDNKCVFDGSAVDGFVRVEESDMYLYPDLSTFTILPWREHEGRVARLICDVYRPMGIPFEGDCRYLLKQVVREAADQGYRFDIGPECEFFLFPSDAHGQPTTKVVEKAGYFDISPLDQGENARRDIVLTLEEMGFIVEGSHHETAPGQHEVDFHYANPLRTADNIQTFKMAVKAVAGSHGLYATFMPKPLDGVDGSGMHVNISLSRDGEHSFFDKSQPMGLSRECRYFIGGLLSHARGITAVCNPLVNSYKRLVPGFEAPVNLTWAQVNRSPLIRIPSTRGQGTRIELRSPDCAANPYLAMALCISAGMDGISRQIEPPEPVGQDACLLGTEEMDALGIEKLPSNLGEAIRAMEDDPFVRRVLGQSVYEKYLQAKKQEWKEYQTAVTGWEIDRYLYKY